MTSMRDPAKEARELFEMKKRAVEYYKDNGVPEKMEEILNAMFYDDPNDVYGHLSNYFESFSKAPLITKLKAREALDSKGQPTVETEVYCMVKNSEKYVASSVVSSVNQVGDAGKPEDKEAEDTERQEYVTSAISYINGEFSERLKDMEPTNQKEIDDLVCGLFDQMRKDDEEKAAKEREEAGESVEAPPVPVVTPTEKDKKPPKSPKGKGKAAPVVIIPDEPKEKLYQGCNSVSAVSSCMCLAGAAVRRAEPFEYITSLLDEGKDKFKMPLPMVTILQSGKAAPGKLNGVKEFMVVPKPGVMTLKESIKNMTKIYNLVLKNLTAKSGVGLRNVSDTGAICPQLDRPEQGLDIIQEACTSLGFTEGEFNIVLNLSGQEIFDYEKGKYEPVTGLQKLSEDMADFWEEILRRYPSVIGIIDPIRKPEKESWMKICEKLSERCYIIGDTVVHRPGVLKDEDLPVDFQTSGVILRMESMSTVSDLVAVTKKMEEANNQVILSTGIGETSDTFPADLAVGLGAKFFKVGAPCRGERVGKLNRLVKIEEILLESDRLDQWEEHVFPKLQVPPPRSESEENGEASEDKPDEKS